MFPLLFAIPTIFEAALAVAASTVAARVASDLYDKVTESDDDEDDDDEKVVTRRRG